MKRGLGVKPWRLQAMLRLAQLGANFWPLQRHGPKRPIGWGVLSLASQPGIGDSRSVHAKENSQPRPFFFMIYMGKGIHPGLGIELDGITHSAHHPGCSRRGRHFALLKHIKGQGIVRLIPRAIGNRYTRV